MNIPILLKYLRDIAALETQKIELNKIIQSLNSEISQYHYAPYTEKIQFNEPEPKKPDHPQTFSPAEIFVSFISNIIASAVICGFFLWISLLVICSFLCENIFNSSSASHTCEVILYVIFGCIFIGIVVASPFGSIKKIREDWKDYEDSQKRYVEKKNYVDMQNQQIEKENQRILNEYKYKKNVLENNKRVYESKLAETELNLKKYYDLNVLYVKYQNVIAVTSFIDYFAAGICNKFDTREGAYDKFDQDFVLNKISNSLEDIKANQITLINTIRAATERVLDLLSDIHQDLNNINQAVINMNNNNIYNANRIVNIIDQYGRQITVNQSVANHIAQMNADDINKMRRLQEYEYYQKNGALPLIYYY